MLIEEVLPAIRQGKKAKHFNKRGIEEIVFLYDQNIVFTDGTFTNAENKFNQAIRWARSYGGEVTKYPFFLMSEEINDNTWEIIE